MTLVLRRSRARRVRGPIGRVADSLDDPKAAFRGRGERQRSISVADEAHSALMPTARITLPHFSVSSAMSLPNSAGEPAIGVAPMSVRRNIDEGRAFRSHVPQHPRF